jgi:hypothetical protein
MLSARKALFLAIESAYDIRDWSNYEPGNILPPFFPMSKADLYKRNKTWIENNVEQPSQYIQLDHERIRIEMMELGIDPEEFFNVWRLTPSVYRLESGEWVTGIEPGHTAAASDENARYCLDVVVSILMKIQSRRSLIRTTPHTKSWTAILLGDQPLFAKADVSSVVRAVYPEGSKFIVYSVVSGLVGTGKFLHVYQLGGQNKFLDFGYLPYESCRIEETDWSDSA